MPQETEPNGAPAALGTPDTGTEARPRDVDDAVIDELRRAIAGVEFGSVLVKIHQGEVVGIETSTKVRLKK